MKWWQLLLLAIVLIFFTWFWDALYLGSLFRSVEEIILEFLRLN